MTDKQDDRLLSPEEIHAIRFRFDSRYYPRWEELCGLETAKAQLAKVDKGLDMCPNPKCINGYIKIPKTEWPKWTTTPCPTCQGTGKHKLDNKREKIAAETYYRYERRGFQWDFEQAKQQSAPNVRESVRCSYLWADQIIALFDEEEIYWKGYEAARKNLEAPEVKALVEDALTEAKKQVKLEFCDNCETPLNVDAQKQKIVDAKHEEGERIVKEIETKYSGRIVGISAKSWQALKGGE